MAKDWKDVRARSGLDKDRVTAHTERMLAEVRAHRLAELRKQQQITQQELAERMQVAQSRVSAIERGKIDATEFGTIGKYVAALGGRVKIVADFGDQELVIGQVTPEKFSPKPARKATKKAAGQKPKEKLKPGWTVTDPGPEASATTGS
ncbi:MAG TPA: XRE family transcriptional regulator [Micromonosporaceae bacterium]|nr:XRE family transcriptional regulator [Micromonosporaceae bacterium]